MSLSREIRDGGLTVIASGPAPGAKTKVVDNAKLVNVVIRDWEVIRDRDDEAALWDPNGEKTYWKTVRLVAAEIRRRWPAKDAPVAREAPAPPRRPRGDAKRTNAATALLRLYPNGPPTSIDRAHMCKLVEGEIGSKISLSTLDRARVAAWPSR
jgi:hypothetical protein